MNIPPTDQLVGTELPSGEFRIRTEENDRFVAAVHADPLPDGFAHPVYVYAATQRGIGISLGGIFAQIGFTMEEGPMLGACTITISQPLRVEIIYHVSGKVVGLEHKVGASTGPFDLMTVQEQLTAPDGTPTAEITNVYVLPRRC
ncbi:hypothetical protein [Conexibacter sp. DBS9H8]|uniref:hypothetical protein n=1 Tax=Conexibacter sp. DBS9H8 TaxID=2937801 RepID=UPI00200E8163|nr:hypothetical protein [Conexibacter sp. DBS9H8]